MCNRRMKFGKFLDYARNKGFDTVATGHYCSLIENADGSRDLEMGADPSKDQSYFLAMITQEQLQSALFPIGSLLKSQVRDIARMEQLPNSEKKDSQGICFLGKIKIQDFLRHYIPECEGDIVNKSGKVLGKHKGLYNYTIGQRKGIGVAAVAPLYVVELRKDSNEVVVAFKDDSLNKGLIANKITLSAIEKITEPIKCKVKIRSSQEPKEATIKAWGEKITVEFDELQSPIATGQSAVFYDGETVLGGGIIESVF